MESRTNMDLLFYISLCSILAGFARGDCNFYNGPAGSYECVLLTPYYSKHQWATCLTDRYIQTYSKGKHACISNTDTYCWYQCMIEVYTVVEGPVYDDCACGPDAPKNVTTPPTVVKAAIPNWCSSPSGDECNWYRECLEKRYPCKEQGNSYALDYVEKFCNLYQAHYSKFDNIGQQWIDAVRKCLQVNLVQILRPFVTKTCEEIKQMSFNSHSGCYIHPDVGKPSICDIGFKNWAKVFWTVKSEVIQDATATFKQMLDVISACGIELLSNEMELIRMKIRQTKDATQERLEKLAGNISDIISHKTDWLRKGIIHFGFPTLATLNRKKPAAENRTDTDTFYINILIAERSIFDLNAVNVTSANVTTEAINVAKAIENGNMRIQTQDGMEFTELSVCANYNCTETSLLVIPAPPEETEDSGLWITTVIIIVCAVTFGIILIAMSIVVQRKKRKYILTHR